MISDTPPHSEYPLLFRIQRTLWSVSFAQVYQSSIVFAANIGSPWSKRWTLLSLLVGYLPGFGPDLSVRE